MHHAVIRVSGLVIGFAVVSASMLAARAANEPYLVGVVVSQSGPASTLGRPAADSVELAANEINAAGGVNGHPLVVKPILDDESKPTEAVNAMRKLLDQHPVAVIGSSGTPTSLAMIPLATAAEVPLISLGSSSLIIDPVSEHKWIFKIPVADTYIARRLLQPLAARKLTRIAVVYRDDDYGKSGFARLEENGKNLGVHIVDAEAIAATATDATTQLTHVKASNPQAVVVWTTLPSALVVLKGYRELNLPYPLFYSEGSANQVFLAQAGNAADGVIFATEKGAAADAVPASDPQKKVLMHYATEFARQYPKDGPPGIFGGFGYDGVYVAAAGLRASRGSGGAKLRDALEHVTYTGVSGVFRLSPSDHNGLGMDAVELVRAENGKFVLAR